MKLSRVHLLETIYSAIMQQLRQQLFTLNTVSERGKNVLNKCLSSNGRQ